MNKPMSTQLKAAYSRLLDVVAPLEARLLAFLSPNAWTSYLSNKAVQSRGDEGKDGYKNYSIGLHNLMGGGSP